MPESKAKRRYSSLQNAVRALHLFSIDEPELRLSTIADALGISRSTAHRLLTSMVSEGFVAKDVNTNLYRLGISILEMSRTVTSTMSIHRVALPILQGLGRLVNESVHLGIFREDKVVFLNRIDSPRSISSISIMGSRMPPHCTSSGQVFLAYECKETVQRIIQKGLLAYTPKTITKAQPLYRLLETVRKQGYSISIEELQIGVASVAAPIRSTNGQVIATVSTPGPLQRMPEKTIADLVKHVTQAASDVSAKYQQLCEAEK